MCRTIITITILLLVSTTLVAQTLPNTPKNVRVKKVINKKSRVSSIGDLDGSLNVNQINNKPCQALKKLSNSQFGKTLRKLLKDGISVEEEDAFMKLNNCFDCAKHKETFRNLGLERTYFEADVRPPMIVAYANKATLNRRKNYGRKERVFEKINSCLSPVMISVPDVDSGTDLYEFELTNPKRIWLHSADCNTIINNGKRKVISAIKELFRGSTLDTDEKAILKAIKCFDHCYNRKNIIEGVNKTKLEEEVHGEEYDELMEIFKNCRIVSTQSAEVSKYLINRLSCRELNSYNDTDIFNMVNTLIKGSTLDSDEQSLLKLLNCLTNDKAKKVIQRVGVQTFKDNFHGSEYNQLIALLFRIELISMLEFDTGSTVKLVENSKCRTFHRLSISRLKALLRLLFNGRTGNREEQAINKLIYCLPSIKVKKILQEPGFSIDDFDSEVDGDEWDELVQILRNKGIRI